MTEHPSAPLTDVDTRAVSAPNRIEILVLVVVLILAGWLRWGMSERMAVEHFDEGVYASNIWFGMSPDGRYPAQHLYAPPLLPALIEWGFVFFSPSNAGAMWPSQLAGLLTVFVIWQMMRNWSGAVAGLWSAGLVAFSELTILLSRSALTDSLLGLWWVLSLYWLGRAIDGRSRRDVLLAAVAVSLGWYTKYNGWMPVGLALGAVAARGVFDPLFRPHLRSALTTCFVVGALAFVLWSPWLWSLQSVGGYQSVAANHRQYVVGLAGWGTSLWRQAAQLASIGSLVLPGTQVFGFLALCWGRTDRDQRVRAAISEHRLSQNTGERLWRKIAIGCVLVSVWSPVLGIALGAIAGGTALLIERRQGRVHSQPGLMSDWILLTWFVGMTLATPLYRPYLRLTLPWWLAACCLCGVLIQRAWSSSAVESILKSGAKAPTGTPRASGAVATVGSAGLADDSTNRNLRPRSTSESRSGSDSKSVAAKAASMLAQSPVGDGHWPKSVGTWTRAPWILTVVVLGAWFAVTPQSSRQSRPNSRPVASLPFTDQTEWSTAGLILAGAIGQHSFEQGGARQAVVYVFGEPALLFQLRLAGSQLVAPVSSLAFADRHWSRDDMTVYLVVGPHARADPQFVAQLKKLAGRLRRLKKVTWMRSPLSALDQPDVDPLQLGDQAAEVGTIELFEVLSP